MANGKDRDVRQVVIGKDDQDIRDFLEENPERFSLYVKRLIRRDMNGLDNFDIIEARLNELITLLKNGSVATQSSTTKQKTVSDRQLKSINSVMSIFKDE